MSTKSVKDKILSKAEFYTLSWTWGCLMSIIGALAILVILIYGAATNKNYKLKKHGWCYYIALGKNWGGVNLGMFFLTDTNESVSTMWHEHGHAIQNCKLGLVFPFRVAIPSFLRYWYREFRYYRRGLTPTTKYDAVWYEQEATDLGRIYRKLI